LETIYGAGAVILEQMMVGRIIEELDIEPRAKSFSGVVMEAKRLRK
jgi:hypothetical protein